MKGRWRITGRRVAPPTFAIRAATPPVRIDADGSTVSIFTNARGVWVRVARMDRSSGYVEIAVNPEAPPTAKDYKTA